MNIPLTIICIKPFRLIIVWCTCEKHVQRLYNGITKIGVIFNRTKALVQGITSHTCLEGKSFENFENLSEFFTYSTLSTHCANLHPQFFCLHLKSGGSCRRQFPPKRAVLYVYTFVHEFGGFD